MGKARLKLASSSKLEVMEESLDKEDSLSGMDVEIQLRELKKRLREEELKNEMLETMIDLASEELNIDIRKKSGTKQSRK